MDANPLETFVDAAGSFAALVRRIPGNRWDGPGLGEWDLRALVGHTSRSLVTVTTYLRTSAEAEDLRSPQEYYAMVKEYTAGTAAASIVRRGRDAGTELGEAPADTVDALAAAATTAVRGAEDRLIEVFGGHGMRLHTYLPTRTFELAVHSLDIAAATGLPCTLPENVLTEATELAARIAVRVGDGQPVLAALTGRTALPRGFSVV
ncbi:maleylpyruvate isomerase N-terminal domain-containing protein [Nocardia halotolerans]|uniref:Maleylpyruvate isomerase N-terminal domain-containing protein n=1 Tax=Nocardia halotolerans TaxID=1755878 RepID=A0ABV8VKM3_9NOCA